MAYKKLEFAAKALRQFGIRACIDRGRYVFMKKTGIMRRRFPVIGWSELSLLDWTDVEEKLQPNDLLNLHISPENRFFFDVKSVNGINTKYRTEIIRDADKILINQFRYFCDKYHDLGEGPDWLLIPNADKKRSNKLCHWCDIDFFDSQLGDIKFIWEPSRFDWVYTLVRAYAATSDNKYVAKFWFLFDSWLDANPPNLGHNYACGQECAIRLMAMCFALFAFLENEQSTTPRLLKLILAIAFHARRIEKNIAFAISTQTNHSITEAAGLYTTGLLFPNLKRSAHWHKLGKKLLTEEGLKQVFPDGSYIQHSMNYHRLMLQDFLWVIRLGQLNGDAFENKLLTRIERATNFLYQMQEDRDGKVPNYGSNDGALILPLNTCDYTDYRPVIQCCWYLLRKEKLYTEGPWDEDLCWLFGSDSKLLSNYFTSITRTSSEFPMGGYYSIRRENSWAMIRCHSYNSRIAQVDPLHLDFWAEGINLLRDSGSYKYFTPDEPNADQYFKSIWAHNTIVVDNSSPVQALSKFSYYPPPKAELDSFRKNDREIVWQGTSYAYNRNPWRITHSRKVHVNNEEFWTIFDNIIGHNSHQVTLQWHLPYNAEMIDKKSSSIVIQLPRRWHMKISIARTDDRVLEFTFKTGEESLYYGRTQPNRLLNTTYIGPLPIGIVSELWKE